MSAPIYVNVDPNALTIPTDQNDLHNFLQSLKDTLVAINHNLSLLMQSTTADLATANQLLQNHDGGISNLDTTMVRVMADIAKLSGGAAGSSTASTSATIAGSKRAPKLSEPAKFDGSAKNRAVSFRVAVSHYLRVSYPSSTVDEQIAFIISCLEGKAHEWLEPYLEQDIVSGTPVTWLHDLTGFWEQFNARWNVSNKTENFRAKFRALKHTKSVQEYFKDFQMYSQTLGYNDVSLRDFFYDGLSVKIKEMLMAQDFDHGDASVTLQTLADKALKIDQRLEAFQAQNKTSSSSSTSTTTTKLVTSPSTAAPTGNARDKLTVGEKVYTIGSDGKAKKGTIQAIGKNSKGAATPTVKWNDGSSGESAFKSLKKDAHPVTSSTTSTKTTSTSSNTGPTPMDLDAAGKGKKPLVCHNCGGRGHFANNCPSKPYSGQGIESDNESENGDL
jgi:hypothetical protein